MESAARRVWPVDGFSMFGLLRQRATAAFEDIDTKEALTVRDLTHLSLWICCCVSLGFIVLWCGDVFKLECLYQPWVAEIPGIWRCLYELLGICIFATYFRDSIRMVLNYDGQHQELLQRKQKVLDDVSAGCSEVLQRAQANAEHLRGILVDNQIRRVRAHIRDVRANLVPTLVHVSQELSGEQQQAFEQAAGRLIIQMVENLQEPGQLAVSLVGNLTDVYGTMQALQDEDEPPLTPPTNELSECQLAQLFPELARTVQAARAIQNVPDTSSEPEARAETFVQHWWSRTLGLISTLRGESAEAASRESIVQVQIPKNTKKDVVDHILGPVLAVLEIPELCRRWSAQEDPDTAKAKCSSHEAWLGCGRPPWESTRACWAFQCCMPFVPWWCSPVVAEDYVYEGSRYPKHWCFGGIWVEVRSQLHERLLFSLCSSIVYGICYMLLAHQEIVEGCRGHSFWGCTWEICQSCTALLALMCNIPAIIICLVHMRRIDALMDCETTIRKLEEIRRVVHTFDERTRTEEQRRILLEAVDRRVMRRIDLVDRFRSHINRRDVSADQIADATDRLERCLQQASETLGPATHWLELPPNWREKQAQEFEENSAALSQEFDVAKPLEPMLPDAPQLALRVFAHVDTVPLEKSATRKALSCMRRCRQRRPKQCPPELLHVRGAASYVLVFPAVQWLQAPSQKTNDQKPQVRREDSTETINTVVGLHEAAAEAEAENVKRNATTAPPDSDLLAWEHAQQIVQNVCNAPHVFEKLNESGAYLQKAYKNLLRASKHEQQPQVQWRQLQQHVLELVLLYLRYCGCKLKVARSVDGDQLLVSVRMREEVAKCHASDLGYVLKVSRHLNKLLGLGSHANEQHLNAFLPYSAHLEECFKDRFGPGRLDLLLKIAMNAPDEFVDDRSQNGDSGSDEELAKEKDVVVPTIQRAPFPALLLVMMEAHISEPDSSVDGFYKAWKDTGDEWPCDWVKEGPPVGETPVYRLVPEMNEHPSQATMFFSDSTQMWTHTGRDGSVMYVCPSKKQTEVPTEGWIRPSSQQEMENGNVVPSYFFDNGPFQAYFGRLAEGSIFRAVDHARLINTILSEVFSLEDMQKLGILTCHFIPHHSSSLRFFKEHITAWWHPWHNQWPLEHIRDYFGEKVALDHDFLGFLAAMCFPIGLAALVQCSVPVHTVPSMYSRTVFGAFVVIWAAVFHACWQRREHKQIVSWGMENQTKEPSSSPAPQDQQARCSLSAIAILCCFKAPSFLALWTFAFQWLLHWLRVWLISQHVKHAIQIQAAVNAIQMLLMDAICKATLPRFSKFHTNKIDREGDDNLIQQMFVHRCIIGYTTLLLGCSMRPLAGLCAQGDVSCDDQLADELEVVFAIRALASFMRDAVTIYRARRSFRKSGQANGYEQMNQGEAWQPRSYLEAQAQMPPRDKLQIICDQLDVVIQLGYVLFFGVLRPRIVVVFLFISLIRVHAHAWGLLGDNRRPFPEATYGLGVRNEVLCKLISFSTLPASMLLVLINSDGPFVGSQTGAVSNSRPSRLLEPYVLEHRGDVDQEVDPIRMLIMIVAMKYILTLLQSGIHPLVPYESAETAHAQKWRSHLLKQLRDYVLGVKEELAEPQQGDEQARSPEQLIRDWVAGAQQLDMDDEDFEPAAAAKLAKETPASPQAQRRAS